MPTYQYICKNCGHELEELQSMKEPALVKCPKCGMDRLARIMSSGSGLIFKGSGFYKTDYLKPEDKKTSSTEKKEEKKEEKKTEGAPAAPAKETKTTPPPPADPKKD